MKYLNILQATFPFAIYTSGSHYRVGFNLNNIGYLINSDDSIMTCSINNKFLSANDIIKHYETEEGTAVIEGTENYTVVAEFVNSKGTLVFYYGNKSTNDILFEKYLLFQKLVGESPSVDYYINESY